MLPPKKAALGQLGKAVGSVPTALLFVRAIEDRAPPYLKDGLGLGSVARSTT
jgi:hypothetical protein